MEPLLAKQDLPVNKGYICETCMKTFRFRSEWIRHANVHKDSRPYVCQYKDCSKAFKRRDALENHVRTHSGGEKPYSCKSPGCAMKFPTKASLRYHTLKHKNERIYKCEFPGCNKSFITEFQLNQHKKAKNVHNANRKLSYPDLRYIRRNFNPANKNNSLSNPIIIEERSNDVKEEVRGHNLLKEVKTEGRSGDMGNFEMMRAPGFEPVSTLTEKNMQKIHYIIEENKYLRKHLEVCNKMINMYEKKLNAQNTAEQSN